MRKIVITACLFLGACAPQLKTQRPTVVQAITLKPVQLATIQKAAASGLKDPGSAQFDDVAATLLSDGTTYICGKVNAKNSYGGYIGFKPFNGKGDRDINYFDLKDMATVMDSGDYIREECRENNIFLSGGR